MAFATGVTPPEANPLVCQRFLFGLVEKIYKSSRSSWTRPAAVA